MRVLLHAHPRNVQTKFDANYSGLCKVVETRVSLLTLRELDTQRVFTANHDAVRLSTVTRPAVPPTHAARAALLPPVARAALQLPPQQAAPPILPAPYTVHHQSASRVAQLNPVQSAPRSHVRAIRDISDVSFLRRSAHLLCFHSSRRDHLQYGARGAATIVRPSLSRWRLQRKAHKCPAHSR